MHFVSILLPVPPMILGGDLSAISAKSQTALARSKDMTTARGMGYCFIERRWDGYTTFNLLYLKCRRRFRLQSSPLKSSACRMDSVWLSEVTWFLSGKCRGVMKVSAFEKTAPLSFSTSPFLYISLIYVSP